jgi:hypothetical protein
MIRKARDASDPLFILAPGSRCVALSLYKADQSAIGADVRLGGRELRPSRPVRGCGRETHMAPPDSGLLGGWSLDSALAYHHEDGCIQAIEPVVDVPKVRCAEITYCCFTSALVKSAGHAIGPADRWRAHVQRSWR